MKRRFLHLPRLLGVGAMTALAVSFLPQLAEGADHTDSPATTDSPLADIGDYYAWMSADTNQLNMITTVNPFAGASASFGTATQYVFHVSSRADFSATTETDMTLLCQFYRADRIECWLRDGSGAVVDYAEGDPSDPSGLTAGGLTVYAGRRNDPFFFNLDGFSRTVETVRGAAAGLTFDSGNCPALDEGTRDLLLAQLTTDADDSAATDDLAGASVLALVVSVNTSSINGGGPILATWASTHAAP